MSFHQIWYLWNGATQHIGPKFSETYPGIQRQNKNRYTCRLSTNFQEINVSAFRDALIRHRDILILVTLFLTFSNHRIKPNLDKYRSSLAMNG